MSRVGVVVVVLYWLWWESVDGSLLFIYIYHSSMDVDSGFIIPFFIQNFYHVNIPKRDLNHREQKVATVLEHCCRFTP